MTELTVTQAKLDFDQIQSEYESKSPRQILELALAKFDNIAISFSGAEDVVLIDMASKITQNFQVFTNNST